MWFRRKHRPLGRRGEDAAVRALRRAGYAVLERNAKFGRYELDVIAREGDTTAFVEVKTRRRSDAITPEDSVGPTKRRHIRAAAHRYIADEDDPNRYYRFDIVSVVIPDHGKPDVTIYRDAFPDQ